MWRDSCELIFACVSSPVHMSKTWPGKLLKATGFRGMLIVAVRCCYLRRNRKEIFRLHTQSSRVSTAFKRLLPWASSQQSSLRCASSISSCFSKEVCSLQRFSLCYRCCLRHVASCTSHLFWGFRLWRGKKDICLVALEDIASITQRDIFGRTLHFVEFFALLLFKFWVYFSLTRPCLPAIQPVCVAFKAFFYFCIFFKLLDYVLVGEKSAIQIWSMIYIIIVLITFVEVRP